jgi:toxin ParE1/3/4
MQLVFSGRAEDDLEEIGDYIAQGNPSHAVTFIREMRDHCRHLIEFPNAARLRPEFGDGVRRSIFGRYLIFYVLHEDVLEIRRVVHGARNLTALD